MELMMFARCLKALTLICLCIAASELSIGQVPAYSVEIIPNNPTTLSPITIRIGVDRCNVAQETLTFPNANTIRVDLVSAVCPGTPMGFETVQVGLLTEGAYSVEVYQSGFLRGATSFAVVAAPSGAVAPIPTLWEGALAFLAIVLGALGALVSMKGNHGARSIFTLAVVTGLFAFTGHAGDATAAEVPSTPLAGGNFVPNRIQVRFNRALLDPTPEDIRDVSDRPGTSALATILGSPTRIRRVIGREPTPFEEFLVRRYPNAPEARLTEYFVLDYSTRDSATAARAFLANDRRIAFVAQDPIVSPAAIPNETYVGASANPPGFQSGQFQWGLHALNFPAAFDKYTGSARIGVVDKGIGADPANPNLYHPDLRTNFRPHLSRNFAAQLDETAVMPPNALLDGNLWDEHYRRQYDANGIAIGWWGPFAGHGTHVAGLIAANWNDESTGVVGGCPDCSLLIGKIPGSSGTSVAAAISHLVDVGVQVINFSQVLGQDSCANPAYAMLCDALAKVRAADVAFIAAAGNSQLTTLANSFPVNQPGVIPVGGLEPGMTFWAGLAAGQPSLQWVQSAPGNGPANALLFWDQPIGSNFGPTLRLVAPAAEVLSTFAPNNAWFIFRPRDDGLQRWSSLDEPFTYQDPALGNVTISTGPPQPPPAPQTPSVGFGTMTGTSMAAPHVSAIAGLVRTVNPLRPATSIENLIATSTTRTTQHAGLTFSIPDAGGAVNAALGSPAAQNRRTPMFGLWSSARQTHFYSTSPQEANAAMRGTLLPRPDGSVTSPGGTVFDFVPQGHAQLSYDRFPQVMCVGTTPCNFSENTAVPRALFEVWTGHQAPGAEYPLRPLWRLSKPSASPTNGRASKYAYAVGYSWEANWEVKYFTDRGYTLDALDGFIVSRPGEQVPQPQGTVRLCRKQYSGAGDLNGDYVLFIEQNSPVVCQAANDCSLPNGNCGINVAYSSPPVGIDALMGYAFPSYNANDDDYDGMPYNVEVAEGRNPGAKDNDIFNVSRLFAYQEVKDIYRRPAEEYEVISTSGQLDAAQKTRNQLIEEFLNNPEHSAIFAPVIRLYRAFLERLPDFEGLEYWTKTYRNGTPLSIVSQSFAASEEFLLHTGGLTNGQFIDYCYSNVLGRAPDAAGRAFWLGQLDSGAMNRGEVMLAFSESAEFVGYFQNNVRVTMLFQSLLRRAPLQVGYDYWLNALNTGTTLQSAIGAFIGTTEYRLRFLPS